MCSTCVSRSSAAFRRNEEQICGFRASSWCFLCFTVIRIIGWLWLESDQKLLLWRLSDAALLTLARVSPVEKTGGAVELKSLQLQIKVEIKGGGCWIIKSNFKMVQINESRQKEAKRIWHSLIANTAGLTVTVELPEDPRAPSPQEGTPWSSWTSPQWASRIFQECVACRRKKKHNVEWTFQTHGELMKPASSSSSE